MSLLFNNNASSTLASDITDIATTLDVAAGEGSEFPSPTGGDYFKVTVEDSVGNCEIMHCTGRTSDTLTVTRGQEGTVARAFSSGALVENRFTAGSMSSFNTYSMASNAEALTGTATNLIINPATNKYVWDQKVSTYGASLIDDASASAALTTLGVSAYAKTLLDDASASAARATLEVNTLPRRNRVCNGDLSVNSINGDTTITPAASTYVADNCYAIMTQASKLNFTRISSSFFAAHKYALLAQTVAAYTPTASDLFGVRWGIEGRDLEDLMWGTASAEPITISFNFIASVSGTYSFSLNNESGNRSYVWTEVITSGTPYTLTKTIPGDTSGTWPTGDALALTFRANLGVGSTYKAPSVDTWLSGSYMGYAGCVDIVATLSAYFGITNVKIEDGTFATPYPYVPYKEREAWCQRYHPTFAPGSAGVVGFAHPYATTDAIASLPFRVRPRVRPTGVVVSALGDFALLSPNYGAQNCTGLVYYASTNLLNGALVATTAGGLVQGNISTLYALTSSAKLRFTGAEL